MKRIPAAFLAFSFLLFCNVGSFAQNSNSAPIAGFRTAGPERVLEQKFISVPDTKLAEEHLRTLTAAPHIAGSPEDRKTADYVARKFREAGLDTRIDEYRVWMNYPAKILVEATAPAGLHMRGPSAEHVDGDPFQNAPHIVTAYNAGSPSGDVEADVVYANYGRPSDFKKLKEMGIDVKGKIVIVRYGQNFRGVKSFIAQEQGAAGVIIYSDPIDDGYFRGDAYPNGPYRPQTAVQRGSVQFMFEYPGDPTTPGIASTPGLPDSKRISADNATNLARVPTTPLSYNDAAPLLKALGGPETPRDWQGALPFTYHVGPGPVKVHLKVQQNYQWVTLWNVIGTIKGSQNPDELVIAGNHRDAWVFGAVDPSSGTAAMLESVHGIGELLKTGWRPKRSIVFASWDGEEEGLIGSTEFAEQFEPALRNAVSYFNMDVAVSGPTFGAASVPSLKNFIRDITRDVPSPAGGSVYDAWKGAAENRNGAVARRQSAFDTEDKVGVGDLGSGSDYTAFLQHLGIPSTDIGTNGPYGVYHSAFDNFAWFTKFADPKFVYEQQMARLFGLEVLRMANTDLLPFDYESYGKEIRSYIESASRRASEANWTVKPDFSAAFAAADHLAAAGKALSIAERSASEPQFAKVNAALMNAERALLTDGLPHRPFFKHAIYAPGEYTGYAAVVIPGVNEAIDKNDPAQIKAQLDTVTKAIERAASILDGARSGL